MGDGGENWLMVVKRGAECHRARDEGVRMGGVAVEGVGGGEGVRREWSQTPGAQVKSSQVQSSPVESNRVKPGGEWKGDARCALMPLLLY